MPDTLIITQQMLAIMLIIMIITDLRMFSDIYFEY